nr:helix-turn-helix domain-containing protein [Myxococcus sp. RHSTA-1-4]
MELLAVDVKGSMEKMHAEGVARGERMEMAEQSPTHALRPFVDRFWSMRTAPGEAVTFAELLPGTGAELMVHLGIPLQRADGASLPASHLLCLRESTLRTAAGAGGLDMFCVRFRAGALRHFIDAEVGDVVDANASFDDLAGPLSRVLREGLAQRYAFVDRVAFAERVLQELRARFVRPDVLVDRALHRIYASGGELRIGAVARELGVVPRHLARRFQATAGVSPKRFARLVRFSKTVRALILERGHDIGRAAVEHGYFDQAHFTHEFVALARQPPGAFLRAVTNRSHFYKPSLAR